MNGSLVDWITHLLTNSSKLYIVINNSRIVHGFDGEIFQFLRILCISVLTPFLIHGQQMLELYNTIISITGERYGVKNETEILRQYDIATATFADTSNEIVEVEIT